MTRESSLLSSFSRVWLVFVFLCVGEAVALAEDPASNLLRNAGFEVATQNSPVPADWSGDREVYRRAEGRGRDGSAALQYASDDPARYRLAAQRITLQPGRKYRFRGWVKTENIAGDESGATFCIEWSDKQGKWMGGSYPSGVKGTSDWTEVTGFAQVPEQAGSCTFSCYVRRGMTGTAWFDDLQVVRVVEPPLRSVLVSPNYRGRITGTGSETIRALVRVDLRDCEIPREKLAVRGVLSSASNGRECGRVERQLGDYDGEEPIVIELPARELLPGEYQLEVALADANSNAVYSVRHRLARVPDDFQAKCSIDEHRRLIVEGQPFFPLGLYWSSINEADMRVYADSKFNCLMPYGSPNRQQMDLADQYGLKVIYSIKDWYAGSRWCPASIRTAEDEEHLVRSRVREFRDHPALLAWYLNDELPQQFLPQLEAHQHWVVEEDPDHPTWVVLYQVNEVAAYINTYDVIGTDPYPIGRKPASMAAQWTAETFRQVDRARPMWQVPQLHNWANYEKVASGATEPHTPTHAEVRSMAWQCIAEGATGLVFYSWYDVKRNPDVSFDEQWAGLKRLAAEIDRMAPVILSAESTPTVTVDNGQPPQWLHWFVRQHRGRLYLIAVNDGDGQGRVAFQLPADSGPIREMSQERAIKSEQAAFADNLAPLAVHLYEIEMK